MMADNLRHWSALSRPPKSALKTIKGGRLSGFTDVNPQWRYQAMTQEFGPVGLGWKYTIEKMWTEPGCDGEVMAFVQVAVQTRGFEEGLGWSEWSDPVPGVGGNHLIAKEAKGLRGNDECWKMAVTDALSVALKMLGVAADIYAGLWDGSKYVAEGKAAEKEQDKATVKTDKATKEARVMPPEALAEGAVFIEKVIPKSRGNQEWAEVILSTGETVIAREPGSISLATNLAQETSPVIVATRVNGKGKTELEELARWRPEPVMVELPPERPTGAF
jgi:hypothetical protein